MTVDTVVVTYNRKEMLAETIKAILEQTFPIRHLYIIDNASTDGTYEYLTEKGLLANNAVKYMRMDSNLGGAGGFYEGIRIASGNMADWIWIMDDDVLPREDCLEKLIEASACVAKDGGKASFFASAVFGPNGEFMNVPHLSDKTADNGYGSWYKYLDEGIVSIKSATFVSVLFNGDAVKKCGLPCKDYFIWADDVEYTTRMTTYYAEGYFAGKSKAIHNRKNVRVLSIDNETDPKRRKLYHYMFRNKAVTARYYNGKSIFLQLSKDVFKLFVAPVTKYKVSTQLIKIKGLLEAIFQYRKFERYITDQRK